jgi:hypothetical protein
VTSGANRLQLNPIHRVGAPFIGPKGTLRYNVRFTPGTVSIRTLDLMPFIRGIVECPSHYTTRDHMTLQCSVVPPLVLPGLVPGPSFVPVAFRFHTGETPPRLGCPSAHLCRQGRSLGAPLSAGAEPQSGAQGPGSP